MDFVWGKSRTNALEAVQALENVYYHGQPESILLSYDHELNNGDLRTVYAAVKK